MFPVDAKHTRDLSDEHRQATDMKLTQIRSQNPFVETVVSVG